MTHTRPTTLEAALAKAANTTGQEREANETAPHERRHQARHRDSAAVLRPTQRSTKMITEQMAQGDLEAVEDLLMILAGGGRESSLSLGARDARSVLALAREDAAIEAKDVFSQADEALVLG